MKQFLDFLPILLFFIVYQFYLDLPDDLILGVNALIPVLHMVPGDPADAIYLATFVAILATLIQVVLVAILSRKLEKMPLITLALLIVFGGATLFFKDPLFIQWKPTVINGLFALVFAGSHFVGDKPLVQRMMGRVLTIEDNRVWLRLSLAWIGFFVFSGFANLIVAPEIDPLNLQFSENVWVNFKLFGLLGLTVIFVLAQSVYLARYMPSKPEETQ